MHRLEQRDHLVEAGVAAVSELLLEPNRSAARIHAVLRDLVIRAARMPREAQQGRSDILVRLDEFLDRSLGASVIGARGVGEAAGVGAVRRASTADLESMSRRLTVGTRRPETMGRRMRIARIMVLCMVSDEVLRWLLMSATSCSGDDDCATRPRPSESRHAVSHRRPIRVAMGALFQTCPP